MDQVQSREAIRAEGAQAAHDGMPMSACRYEEGTDAREEWETGYRQVCAATARITAQAIVGSGVAR